MTPDELSERLIDFAARIGKVVDALPDTRIGRHIAGQLVRCGTSPAPNYEEAQMKLKLWAKYSDSDGGVLNDTIQYGPEEKPQRTLVLIKPDNFRFPNARPGGVIDLFSRTTVRRPRPPRQRAA